MPFMSDLTNKNSLIYSEWLKAIDTFISGISFYIILEKASKKILKAYDIKYRGYINIKLNINNLVEFNEKQFHVIYIDYN